MAAPAGGRQGASPATRHTTSLSGQGTTQTALAPHSHPHHPTLTRRQREQLHALRAALLRGVRASAAAVVRVAPRVAVAAGEVRGTRRAGRAQWPALAHAREQPPGRPLHVEQRRRALLLAQPQRRGQRLAEARAPAARLIAELHGAAVRVVERRAGASRGGRGRQEGVFPGHTARGSSDADPNAPSPSTSQLNAMSAPSADARGRRSSGCT